MIDDSKLPSDVIFDDSKLPGEDSEWVNFEGEVFDPEEPDSRSQFVYLLEVARIERNVVTTLHSEVYPHYRDWRWEVGPDGRPVGEIAPGIVRPRPLSPALEAALDGWQAQWNLVDEWVRDYALDTLRLHANFEARYGAENPTLLWPGVPSGLREAGLGHPSNWELKIPFRTTEGNPSIWKRPAARERILREFTELLDARLNEAVEDFIQERQYERVPKKRALTKKKTRQRLSPTRHFRWLARYQVHGLSRDEIARGYSVAPSTVSKSIQMLADRIGLTRRAFLPPR